jgi:hypothetical protein
LLSYLQQGAKMVEEKDYTDILQAVALIDPILEKWSKQYGQPYPIDYQDRMRGELTAFLSGVNASMKEHQLEFIY